MREVATVEKQQVGILGPLLLQHGYAAQESAATRLHRVGQLYADGQNRTMRVVRVQNRQLLLLLGHCV